MSIEVKSITKYYGKTCALNDVSVTFDDNKIYGLLGRNGAGKTSLLSIISNRIFAENGTVAIDGMPAQENDAAIGRLYAMGEKTYYPESMRIKDVFKWTKLFYPQFDETYAKSLADQFGLKLNKKVKSLSTGFLTIFKLIVALSVNTPYLLLDEPVLGLDANNRDLFYRLLLEKYSNNPFTVIISTHLIEEVANLIEDVVIIKEGRIICSQAREKLLSDSYSVSGKIVDVDVYTAGKELLGCEVMAGFKTAYIMGQADYDNADGLEIAKVDLQKLFIQLTNI